MSADFGAQREMLERIQQITADQIDSPADVIVKSQLVQKEIMTVMPPAPDKALGQAAASLLETHLNKHINLVEHPALLEIVQMTYPGVRARLLRKDDEDSLFIPDNVDVYRVEVTHLLKGDESVCRVGEQRAMDEVAKQLKCEGVSYVTVVLEDRS